MQSAPLSDSGVPLEGMMNSNEDSGELPIAVVALDVPPRATLSNYPPPFASRMAGREKRVLGNLSD